MTGYIVKEEGLIEALIQSIDDTFQTMEGAVVEPKPVPHGLLCAPIPYSCSNVEYTITPGVMHNIDEAVQKTGADAYELGQLLKSRDYGLIPVQLYKLKED